ncbi:MAG: hypothetical protein PVF05_00115 [Gemmatimonadales bacterium]|jgi:hypothetical protein
MPANELLVTLSLALGVGCAILFWARGVKIAGSRTIAVVVALVLGPFSLPLLYLLPGARR